MPDHYDSLEIRDPATREREQFARLPDLVARAMTAPGWAKQLAGADAKSVTSRAALAKLPLLRKSELLALQKDHPPFGGFNVTPPGKVKRLQMSPGPIFEPEGHGDDFAGAARALHAAGFRSGDIVHNSFSYHLTPGAWIMEAGAHALGCAVIPGGVGNTALPGADFERIIDSVDRRLFTLPAGTLVMPGHGLDTTVGTERPHLDEWVARGW